MKESQIAFAQEGDAGIIALAGSLELAIIPEVKEKIEPYIKEKGSALLIDLTNVSYIDSSGIGLLIYIAKTINGQEGTVKYVVPAGFVYDVLHMVHFDKLFSVYKTRDKAIKSFAE